MILYTSYYAKYHKDSGVQVSNSAPSGGGYKNLSTLSPPWELVSGLKQGTITPEEFTQKYLQFLERFDLDKEISTLKDGDVLLCWEGKDKFCHRHILADQLRKLGHKVAEL